MLLTVISHLINSILSAIVLFYLAKPSQQKVMPDFQGHFRLRMGKAYCFMVVVFLLIAFVFIAATWVYSHDIAILILAPITVLIFGGGGLHCLLYFKNHYLLYTLSFVEVSDVRERVNTMAWREIKSAKFNALTGLIHLKSKSGDKLKVNGHLKGLKGFLSVLEERNQISVTT